MVDNLTTRRRPHIRMSADVVEHAVEHVDPVRLSNQIRMKGNAHHATGLMLLCFTKKNLEGAPDHAFEFLQRTAGGQESADYR